MAFIESRKNFIDSLLRGTANHDLWIKIRGNRIILACLILLGAVALVAVLAPYVAPFDPAQQSLPDRLRPPSLTHLMGTDYLGRDILSRVIFGARTSLTIAGAVVSVSLTFGVAAGALAG